MIPTIERENERIQAYRFALNKLRVEYDDMRWQRNVWMAVAMALLTYVVVGLVTR